MRHESYGVVPLLKNKTKVLLVQSLEGRWGFPKGHAEAVDKNGAATALRELKEEAGVFECSLDEGHVFTEEYSFKKDGKDNSKIVYFYIGDVFKEEVVPCPGEILRAEWFEFDKALEILSFEGAKNVLRKVLETRNLG